MTNTSVSDRPASRKKVSEGNALWDRQLLVVVGKGGVGKTTVSAALALQSARRGKRTLIAMANVKERLSRLLEVDPIGDEIVRVAPGVDAVNMSPSSALEEYAKMVLKVRPLYEGVFGNRIVRAFLRGTPGIEAWSMLGKAYFHATSRERTPRRREVSGGTYDLVILDAPATGHGLDMLRVPQVIVNVAPPGLLRREAERALELLRDPNRAGAVVVTLAEHMPTHETIELHSALEQELQISTLRLVINGLLSPLFEPEERSILRDLSAKIPPSSSLAPFAEASRTRALRERLQAISVGQLRQAISSECTELPYLFVRSFGKTAVESLSHSF